MVSSNNILVQKKEKQNVRRTSPIWLNATYSIGWMRRKKMHIFQDGGHILETKEHPSLQCEPSSEHLQTSCPPYFSLVNTFNCFMCRYNIYKRFLNSILLPVAFEILYRHHCLINYIDTKAKCRHLKNIDL
jgi:hypothetical protein